jgi:predicted aspartyl protease
VPIHLAETAIIVDAQINNRPVSLMFDTGFSATVQVSENVNIGKPTGTMGIRDFVGTFEAKTVKVTSLKLGTKDIDTKDLDDAILGRDDMTSSFGVHCDGIMGFGVIKHQITGINFEKSRFDFYPDSVDISKWVPDNKKTFLLKLLPTGNSSMEMLVETPSGEQMTLALDTGNSFYATTHRDVLERVGLWKPNDKPKYMKQSFVASGAVDSWSIKLDNMKIFGVTVPTSVWDIIDLPSSSAEGDGTVGFGFLKNFNIIIDYSRRRVWLENWTGKTSSEDEGETGIIAAPDRAGDVRVVAVAPESPADKAGIKRGDKLLSMDGSDLDNHYTYRKLRQMLSGPVGSKVKLAVSSGGSVKRLELERSGMWNVPATAGTGE